MSAKKIRPFLKWAGSKFTILDDLLTILPSSNRFYDVFMGSGAVMLNVTASKIITNDANGDLLLPWRAMGKDLNGFIAACEALFTSANDTPERYYALRDEFNERTGDALRRAALFIYLNRHGFNGLCRYNRDGKFNTSFAHNTRKTCPSDAIRQCATKSVTKFMNVDFRQVMSCLVAGDVAYCDPPYWPLTGTADFNRYHHEHFSRDDHLDLAHLASEASRRGAIIIISNHLIDETRNLYSDAKMVIPVLVSRTISCRSDRRTPIQEAFFTFGETPEPIFRFPNKIN